MKKLIIAGVGAQGSTIARRMDEIKAILVFKNGVVYTVDKQRSRAQAVAVRGKDIVYVGNSEGVKEYMVVLERNLFEIPESEIADTQLLMTVFEGQAVYRDSSV